MTLFTQNRISTRAARALVIPKLYIGGRKEEEKKREKKRFQSCKHQSHFDSLSVIQNTFQSNPIKRYILLEVLQKNEFSFSGCLEMKSAGHWSTDARVSTHTHKIDPNLHSKFGKKILYMFFFLIFPFNVFFPFRTRILSKRAYYTKFIFFARNF